MQLATTHNDIDVLKNNGLKVSIAKLSNCAIATTRAE